MIEVVGQLWDSVLGVRLDGERLLDNPEEFIPRMVECLEQNDCTHCVVEMRNLDAAAYYPFWEEFTEQTDSSELTVIQRCAIISEDWTEQWARNLMGSVFHTAEIEWFEESQPSHAWKWVAHTAPHGV